MTDPAPLTRVECVTIANTARIHIDKLFAQIESRDARIAELKGDNKIMRDFLENLHPDVRHSDVTAFLEGR